MNILIIYPWFNQQELMRNFSLKLGEHGVLVDVICYNNLVCEKNTSIKWPYGVVKYLSLLENIEIMGSSRKKKLLKKVRKLLDRYCMKSIFPLYDIVDFHAYYPFYHDLMKICIRINVKFDITLWGSDVMRTPSNHIELLRFGFDNCFRIKGVDSLLEKLVDYYGHIYDDKCRMVYFGSGEVDNIDTVSDLDAEIIKKRVYGDTGEKKIVVCGYNGGENQNHFQMIKALSNLDDEEKRSIIVVFPMTYLGSENYRSEVKKQAQDASLSYIVLDHFLNAKEVAAIRKTADIVINVQNTDALADSLKGHLYCENICIFGDWLKYNVYTKNDIYYIKTRMNDITLNLKSVLHDYSEYKNNCIGNHHRIKEMFSWESTIQKQISVYVE